MSEKTRNPQIESLVDAEKAIVGLRPTFSARPSRSLRPSKSFRFVLVVETERELHLARGIGIRGRVSAEFRPSPFDKLHGKPGRAGQALRY